MFKVPKSSILFFPICISFHLRFELNFVLRFWSRILNFFSRYLPFSSKSVNITMVFSEFEAISAISYNGLPLIAIISFRPRLFKAFSSWLPSTINLCSSRSFSKISSLSISICLFIWSRGKVFFVCLQSIRRLLF